MRCSTAESCRRSADRRQRRDCRIFTEAGEAYLILVVRHLDAFRAILDGILECISFKDLEIIKMTFNFWYGLALLLDHEHYEQYKPLFVDIFGRKARDLKWT